MNEMSQRMDALCALEDDGCAPEPLSELEAFISIDSRLATLNKEYLEARDYRRELANMNGCDDPMVEVAMDMEDSCWCAMQARYLKLREERQLMEQAQRLIRASELEIEKEKEEARKRQSTRFAEWARILQLLIKGQKSDPIWEWYAVLLLIRPIQIGSRVPLRQQFAA